jgi:putative sterol carrier protein
VIPGLNAVIQFNLDAEKYYLTISGNNCKADKGTHPKPNLTIISPKDTWIKISMGEIDGTKAFMKKMFKFEGDMNLLTKMNKIFAAEEKGVEVTQKTVKKFENIPDHRGPIKIKGTTWLILFFIPWYILWIWGGLATEDLLPRIIVALIASILTIYHIITNRPTSFELLSTIYFILSAFLYYIGSEFFMKYQLSINYIIIGAIWLGSLMEQFSTTAQYSKFDFPKDILGSPEFVETNRVITGVWGLYFVYASISSLGVIEYYPDLLAYLLILISLIVLIPLFAFTFWFQKWYPIKISERES